MPKISGYCLAGWAKNPPKLGPTTDPIDQTNGMMEKAFGCSTLSVTISATMVRMIPTIGHVTSVPVFHNLLWKHSPLPLPAPWIARTVIAIGNDVDMPQMRKVTMVLMSPQMSTGFLPNRSDALPHGTAVILWAIEKTADVRPAHRATLFCSTPKSRIIAGRYGKTDV